MCSLLAPRGHKFQAAQTGDKIYGKSWINAWRNTNKCRYFHRGALHDTILQLTLCLYCHLYKDLFKQTHKLLLSTWTSSSFSPLASWLICEPAILTSQNLHQYIIIQNTGPKLTLRPPGDLPCWQQPQLGAGNHEWFLFEGFYLTGKGKLTVFCTPEITLFSQQDDWFQMHSAAGPPYSTDRHR